jgi:ParB family chromosome partitioning protein
MKIPVNKVLPNPDQPRTVFDQAELDGLALSIKENTLIQPIIVEKAGDQYILIDGERRWRAHKINGADTIEAVVRESVKNNKDRLTHALVANVQRSAMGPVDEAHAYKKLVDELGSVDATAAKVGVSSATVSMRLDLLGFHEVVQKLFNLKRLPLDLSVTSALKRLKPEQQARLATTAATRNWSAPSILRMVARETKEKGKPTYVQKHRRPKVYEPVGDHFDALAMVTNAKKLTPALMAASRATCRACSLFDEASPIICKQCPLPDLLNRWQPKGD